MSSAAKGSFKPFQNKGRKPFVCPTKNIDEESARSSSSEKVQKVNRPAPRAFMNPYMDEMPVPQ